jgi:hypothetical protein
LYRDKNLSRDLSRDKLSRDRGIAGSRYEHVRGLKYNEEFFKLEFFSLSEFEIADLIMRLAKEALSKFLNAELKLKVTLKILRWSK